MSGMEMAGIATITTTLHDKKMSTEDLLTFVKVKLCFEEEMNEELWPPDQEQEWGNERGGMILANIWGKLMHRCAIYNYLSF